MLQYYFEGLPRVTQADAQGWGLGYAFPAGLVCAEYTGSGPGGNAGCLGAVTDERIGFYGDRQRWLKIPPGLLRAGAPVIWVGCDAAAPPAPEQLQTADPISGCQVRLRDGRLWTVPLARGFDSERGLGYNALPASLALDDRGAWTSGGLDPRLEPLWNAALRWWDFLHREAGAGGQEIRFDAHTIADDALLALSYNYRLARPEIALLGLLDDQGEMAARILNALVDWATFLGWCKKKTAAAAGSSSCGGPAD